jgi:lipopolysaccharide biosynthesis protein
VARAIDQRRGPRATYLDLIGSERQVRTILSLFENQRRLGIVGPERFRASSRHGRPGEMMGVSRETIEAMAIKMGGAEKREYDVFHGTMFWVRPHALAPLRRLCLVDAFAPEAGASYGGALAHAGEGVFNHSRRCVRNVMGTWYY